MVVLVSRILIRALMKRRLRKTNLLRYLRMLDCYVNWICRLDLMTLSSKLIPGVLLKLTLPLVHLLQSLQQQIEPDQKTSQRKNLMVVLLMHLKYKPLNPLQEAHQRKQYLNNHSKRRMMHNEQKLLRIILPIYHRVPLSLSYHSRNLVFW